VITIAAYKGISVFSRLICWFNRSPYSHISVVDTNYAALIYNGREIEAWRGMVQESRPPYVAHKAGTQVDLFDVDLTAEQCADVLSFLGRQIGKDYDWMGILHFVTRRSEYTVDQDKWFCSELVAAAFAQAGKPLLERIPAYKVYPGMLVTSPHLTHRCTFTVPARKAAR